MRLSIALGAYLASCAASATPTVSRAQAEVLSVQNFTASVVSSGETSSMSVSFIVANNVSCSAEGLSLYDSKEHACGTSAYSFAVFTSADVLTFMVRVYHQLSPTLRKSGQDSVPAPCHVIPGSSTLVCQQSGEVVLDISDDATATSG